MKPHGWPLLVDTAEDNDLVLLRRLLRDAIDESGWKHEAVAAVLHVGGPYLSKMLAGTKPITDRHIRALPREIGVILARRYAEAFGLVVITSTEEQRVIGNLLQAVGSAFATLGGQLPMKVDRMARASPREETGRNNTSLSRGQGGSGS